MKSKEAAIGEGVEGAADVRGLCDGEGILEKGKSGMFNDEVDEKEVDEKEAGGVLLGESRIKIGLEEWYPTGELGMTRGERRGLLCAWMGSSLIFLSEPNAKLD